MAVNKSCEVCGAQGTYSCGGCMNVSYCSKKHQKEDWAKHKQACAPFKVVDSAEMGRHLVATRDILEGEVVLREEPLVVGPAPVSGPVCLGCLNGVASAEVTCPRCGWPLCSPHCAMSPNHLPECDWAVSKRKAKVSISQFVVPHPTYGCILALRVLYQRDHRPGVWARLSALEAHRDSRKDTAKEESDRFSVAGLLRRFYRLDQDFSEEEILDVCGIIQVNSHEVPLSEPAYNAIYWNGSLVEHSCRANCSKSFSEAGELVIRAAEVVPKGGHLSICYTEPFWATPARRRHLAATKFFDCFCSRCADVTEFGTYFSAINCLNRECGGHMVPESFCKKESSWRCGDCGLEASLDLVSRLLSKWAETEAAVDRKDLSSCRGFLEAAAAELPPAHQYVTEVSLALAQGYGQPHGLQALRPQQIAHKETLLRHLVSLTDKLLPGECRIRGVLRFELNATLVERSRRESANLSPDAVRSLLLESRRFLEETLLLLQLEPASLPEGLICAQARENLRDLNLLLASTHIDAPL